MKSSYDVQNDQYPYQVDESGRFIPGTEVHPGRETVEPAPGVMPTPKPTPEVQLGNPFPTHLFQPIILPSSTQAPTSPPGSQPQAAAHRSQALGLLPAVRPRPPAPDGSPACMDRPHARGNTRKLVGAIQK
jgi:hypothetical protein